MACHTHNSNYDSYYVQAQRVRRIVHDELTSTLQRVHVIATPTAPSVAPKLTELTMRSPTDSFLQDLFTVPASLAGVLSFACDLLVH